MKKITKDSKIALVELSPTEFGEYNGDSSHDVYTKFKLPPRALPTLQGILLEDGWKNVQQITPVYHGKDGKLTFENEKTIFESDVLAISSLTRTSPQSMKLVQEYKIFNHSGIVIAGGFDPTFRYKDWLETGADIVVIGEGDRTFPELLNRLTCDASELSDIAGIAFNKNKEIQKNALREILTPEELGKLAHPYYDRFMRNKIRAATVETSRGCPNACEFCSVTEFYGRKYRMKPLDYVIEELKNVLDIGRDVFFVDDNLAAGPRRTIELLNRMTELGLNKKWHSAQVTVKIAENQELLNAFKRANVRGLYIGIESIHDEALDNLGKPYSAQQNKDNIKKLKEQGFWIHGMMVVGTDSDTLETLKETSEWAKTNLHSLQLFPATPLPGTILFNKMKSEGRILTYDYSLYDCQHVVFRPKNLSPFQLQQEIYNIYTDFYSPMNILKKLPSSPKKKLNLGLLAYLHLLGGKEGMLYSPQSLKHLEFLKGVR
jgi:radical SAM superfamily enzyme YgiQ (UPF0313 family)